MDTTSNNSINRNKHINRKFIRLYKVEEKWYCFGSNNFSNVLYVVICNFTPVEYKDYVVGVPRSGTYKTIFSSDSEEFGGKCRKPVSVSAKKSAFLEMPYSVTLDIAPMSAMYLKRTRNKD